MADEEKETEQEEKVEEAKKEEKEEKEGFGVWKIIGLVIIFGIIAVVAVVFEHFSRLQRDLEHTTSVNQPKQVTPTVEEALPTKAMEATGSEGNDEALIKAAVLSTIGLDEESVDFVVTENTGTHAKGNVKETDAVGGGYWLAAKTEDGWVHVYDGQAHPTCELIEPYDFPLDMVEECLDDDGEVMAR